jgi:ATP-dependent Lhr-like helicase
VRDYSPAWLDELTLTGEVIWSGAGSLPGSDGWVSLHLADSAMLPEREPVELPELEGAIIDALASGGAYFFRQLATAVGVMSTGSVTDKELETAIWELVWLGLITNDTFSPLRAYQGGPVSKPRTRAYRAGSRPRMPKIGGPPTVGGRWSLLPAAAAENTVRAKATAEQLLERHGVVTRGAVMNEGIRGGFALTYRVLSGFEETGRARRGYFIEGLGAAQFATGATVDRLRQFVRADDAEPGFEAIVLAATDPANAYGAALPWPKLEGHRPGRKAGALVVLVDGALALYLERGGKSALTFGDDPRVLAAASAALVTTVRRNVGKLRVDKANGDFIIGTPLGDALVDAGFQIHPGGLRLRA